LIKMNLYFLSAVVIIFAITLTVIGYRTSANERKKADELAELKARKMAAEVNNYFNQAMEMTNTIALSLLTLKDEGHASRPLALAILKRGLENNPNYYATWTMWEANGFDNKDSEYAKHHNLELGLFNASYFRSGDDVLKQNYGDEDAPNYESDDDSEYEEGYYAIPKATKKSYVDDPTEYSFTGDEKYMVSSTSVVAPVVENDQFLGVIGIDIDFETLMRLNSETKVWETGFSAIITNNEVVSAHPDKDPGMLNRFCVE